MFELEHLINVEVYKKRLTIYMECWDQAEIVGMSPVRRKHLDELKSSFRYLFFL